MYFWCKNYFLLTSWNLCSRNNLIRNYASIYLSYGFHNLSYINSSNNNCDHGASIRSLYMTQSNIQFSTFSQNSGTISFGIYGPTYLTKCNIIENNSTINNGIFYSDGTNVFIIIRESFIINNLITLFHTANGGTIQTKDCFIIHNLTLISIGTLIYIPNDNCLSNLCLQTTHLNHHLSTGVCLAQLTPYPTNQEINNLDITPCLTLPNPPTPPMTIPPSPTSCKIYSNEANSIFSYMTILHTMLNTILIIHF